MSAPQTPAPVPALYGPQWLANACGVTAGAVTQAVKAGRVVPDFERIEWSGRATPLFRPDTIRKHIAAGTFVPHSNRKKKGKQ